MVSSGSKAQMTSGSNASPSLEARSDSSHGGSDDFSLGGNENNFPFSEKMEKSMTNLNVNLATIVYKVEEMNRNHKEMSAAFAKQHAEFCAKFEIHQQLLKEKIKRVRLEHDEMRKMMRGRPYHVVIIEYKSEGNFEVEIFNPYCVPIDYTIDHNVLFCHRENLEGITENVEFSDLETVKLFECYRYNAYYNFVGMHTVHMEPNHLIEASSLKVLSSQACSSLKLNESLQLIEIGFGKFKWTINLKWVNGDVFYKGWIEFVRNCNIHEGDQVVISKQFSTNSFRVVLFSDTLCAASLSDGVDDDVKEEFNSSPANVPIELEDDGHDESVFNSSSESVSDLELIDISSSSEESNEDEEQPMVNKDQILDEEPASFIVVLKYSHLDNKCHGAYISTDLRPIYSNWERRTNTTLMLGGRQWIVQALRVARQCRFGIGWDDFIADNELGAHTELLFVYLGEFRFEVLVLN
ncbi:hypothetical protein AgCh_004118 [Apium graveolens]